MSAVRDRVQNFCRRFHLRLPILLAPMSGVPAPALSAAVADAGGLGACGVLMLSPDEILSWATTMRAASTGGFQLNNWIRDPDPVRDTAREASMRHFLKHWGPDVPAEAGDASPPDFTLQCSAMLAAAPAVISSVMGLYEAAFVQQMKERGITWFAVISTVAEARRAEAAGADVIIAQGLEAGGHRASFDPRADAAHMVGSMALLPAVVDAVSVPVVATGGITDARGIAAACMLGASAVQIGTGYLRCPEAGIHPAWAAALARTDPEDTQVSRVFSGRAGRSLTTAFVRAATAADAPDIAPYPVQRGLTAPMRSAALRIGDVERMQAWAGQSARLAAAAPAKALTATLWQDTLSLLEQAWL